MRGDPVLATVEEKLAKSLSAESIELIPYLPFLLQDLWDLGSSPADMLDLIKRHIGIPMSMRLNILDLACGKGAVSVFLAKEIGCTVKGIDIMPDFIEFAKQKAKEYGVESLCEFVVGDINKSVMSESGFDVVVLGAVGDVLGSPDETIRKLKQTIHPGGHIMIDDAYGKQGSDTDYFTKQEWVAVFEKTRVRLIEDKVAEQDEIASLNRAQQGNIVKRANELKKKYPEKTQLFDLYIDSQLAECHELENEILGVTMLLQDED